MRSHGLPLALEAAHLAISDAPSPTPLPSRPRRRSPRRSKPGLHRQCSISMPPVQSGPPGTRRFLRSPHASSSCASLTAKTRYAHGPLTYGVIGLASGTPRFNGRGLADISPLRLMGVSRAASFVLMRRASPGDSKPARLPARVAQRLRRCGGGPGRSRSPRIPLPSAPRGAALRQGLRPAPRRPRAPR
jgi:hypothetical protein